MKHLLSLKKEDLSGKVCLLRVDLNIEYKKLRAGNHRRILAIIPTLKFLIKKKVKVVILSHRGRPKPAERTNSEFRIKNSEFSLKPFAGIFSKKLNCKVNFISNFNFAEIKKKVENSPSGSVFLTENLRYFNGEEKNDKNFAKRLASLGDFFVNDAFGVSHRANASVAWITKFLPSYAGFQLEKEIKNLSSMMKNPKKPLAVILGGAKISDKIGLIKNFSAKADYFLIGGGIAHNFLKAQGLPIGNSIFEENTVDFAKRMLKNNLPAGKAGKIILPTDYVIKDGKILDIGPKTVEKYSKIIKNAKTIIWNGPMGYFEDKKFAKGSKVIIKSILNSKSFAVIGGGETTALFTFLNKNVNIKNNIFLSTGGGAMLEYLAGEKLPGIEALNK